MSTVFVINKRTDGTNSENKPQVAINRIVCTDNIKYSLFIANNFVSPLSDFYWSYNIVWRFDLLANGGASLTLSYERAPFPTLHRTVWLPWNVFHVMDTVVMKREENDIPSCYLTGLNRPNPLILATPLSTLYKSSPEDSPIIPETQVRPQSQRSPSWNIL